MKKGVCEKKSILNFFKYGLKYGLRKNWVKLKIKKIENTI